MSLVLDALRRGRARQPPRTDQHAAQSDAVLQTLGYPRSKPTSAAGPLKRAAGWVVGGVLFLLIVWGTFIWLT